MTDRFPSHWLSKSQLMLTPPGLGADVTSLGPESSGTAGAPAPPLRTPAPLGFSTRTSVRSYGKIRGYKNAPATGERPGARAKGMSL